MYKRLTEQQHDAIIATYLDYESVADIRKRFNVSHATVYETLKSRGIKPRRITIRKLSWAQRVEVCQLYKGGMNSHRLAEKYNLSVPAICYLLKRGNITIRPSAFAKTRSLNENVLNKTSERVFYWLGFLMADCHVRKADSGGQAIFALHLGVKDIAHLRCFRNFLQSTHKIERHDNACRLSIRSNKLIKSLSLYGIGFNGIRNPPPKLLTNRHFWRGFVDGDGSLGIHKIGACPRVATLHLVGQENILLTFIAFAKDYIKTRITPYQIKRCIKSTFQIGFSFRAARKLIRVLYTRHTISLRRKQIIADRIMRKFSLN